MTAAKRAGRRAADHAESRAADYADHADATRGLGFALRLLPSFASLRGDPERIVGDLLEDAAYRSVSGARLRWWLLGECATIAAGLSITRMRGWLVLPPMREVASGFAVDGRGVLRGGHAQGAVVRAVIFCGSLATIVLGVELLVAALMSAAGL